MAWMQSLIRLADLEVETLQKRLKDIGDRRCAIEAVLAELAQESRAETVYAQLNAEAGWYLIGFREGWKLRDAKAKADLKACKLEEQGARDALSRAFEAQKKYENLAEAERVAASKQAAKREGAALDELALRRAGTR